MSFLLKNAPPFLSLTCAQTRPCLHLSICTVQNTEVLVCVNQQVCILHLELGTVLVIRWSAETEHRSTPRSNVHLKWINQQMIPHWPLTLFFSPPPPSSVTLLRSVSARVGACLNWISLRSPEIAQLNQSGAHTAAHMLCDGVVFPQYPGRHTGHSCSTLPLHRSDYI